MSHNLLWNSQTSSVLFPMKTVIWPSLHLQLNRPTNQTVSINAISHFFNYTTQQQQEISQKNSPFS